MSARACAALILGLLTPGAVFGQIRIGEHVDVTRVLVDVRVTDARGQPVSRLATEDFSVELDGRLARVEWAEWVGLAGPVSETAGSISLVSPSLASPPGPAPHEGRLIVFLFQKHLTPSRAQGLLRMMRESRRFVDRLGPRDRAAVVVLDSRLRIWQDFTSNRERLGHILGRGILTEPPQREAGGTISLAEHLPETEAARAHSPEMALGAVGRALQAIPGAKSLVLFGYGFGELQAPFGDVTLARAKLDAEYDRAREALVAARTTVFALDITDAASHTLETGLMTVAEETGGFYARTHEFSAAAFDRLGGALRGYYVLAVEKPPGVAARAGRHEIRVRTRLDGATVTARRYYFD